VIPRGIRTGLAAAGLLLASAAASAAAGTLAIVQLGASDYPSGVRLGAAEYRVLVEYELAASGTASSCRVARSSGEPRIDQASCRIVTERLRLRPTPTNLRGQLGFFWLGERSLEMRNPAGAPLPISPMMWVSARDYPAAALRFRQTGAVGYEARVSANGTVLSCTILSSSNSSALDRRTCQIVTTRGVFIPASDGAGGYRDGVYRGRIEVAEPPPQPVPPAGSKADRPRHISIA
jgi:TonB family protein